MKNELKLIISDSKYKEGDKLIVNETLLLEKLMEYVHQRLGENHDRYYERNRWNLERMDDEYYSIDDFED